MLYKSSATCTLGSCFEFCVGNPTEGLITTKTLTSNGVVVFLSLVDAFGRAFSASVSFDQRMAKNRIFKGSIAHGKMLARLAC